MMVARASYQQRYFHPECYLFRKEYSKHVSQGIFDIREMSGNCRFKCSLCDKQCQVAVIHSDLKSPSSTLAKQTQLYYAAKVAGVNDIWCVQTLFLFAWTGNCNWANQQVCAVTG